MAQQVILNDEKQDTVKKLYRELIILENEYAIIEDTSEKNTIISKIEKLEAKIEQKINIKY